MKCCFIVSTGRTGTQTLARVIQQVDGDEIAAYHEPKPSRPFRFISTIHAAGILPDWLTLLSIRILRGRFINRNSKFGYVESNNFLFGVCGLLHKNFQNVRILHVVRDPRDYAESHLKHGVFKGFKGVVGRFMPYWLIKPRHLNIKNDEYWLKMSPKKRLYWFWSLVNRVIEKDSVALGADYRVVRFEDLFSDIEVFVDVLRWLGVDESKLEKASALMTERHNVGRYKIKNTSPDDHESLVDICGDQMQQYGYTF